MAKKPAKKRAGRQPPPDQPNEQAEPWERQQGETLVAFAAFRAYLEAGADRSITGVARKLGKSASLLSRWSTAKDWQSRIAAWEDHTSRQHAETYVDEIQQRTRRQAEISRLHLEALALPARELLRRITTNPELLQHMALERLLHVNAQAARALKNVIVVERLALGISTENLGGHDGGPLTPGAERAGRMTDEEIDTLLLGAELEAYNMGREDVLREKESKP